MSISHWKLLNHLRDYLNKSSNDRGVLFILNKEWLSLLQKVPSTYGEVEHVSRRKDHTVTNSEVISKDAVATQEVSTPATTQPVSSPVPKVATKELHSKEGYSFPQMLSEIKRRMSPKASVEDGGDVVPRWRPKKDIISKPSISSRTRHVVSSLATAESIPSRLKRLEDLIDHLDQYEEAKHFAIKEGAILLLLRLRQVTDDMSTMGAIRQGLAMLGHVDPLPARGIRILSIDGGGVRGVIVIEILKKLEELTGKRVFEMFDYICGVSTGAILVGVMGAQKKSLEEVSFLYKEMSKKIFNQSAFWGTSNLVWSHSYYSTDMWEHLLKTYVGEIEMIKTTRDDICPKIAAVSAVVNQPKVMAYVFRNYSLPHKMQSQYVGSNKYRMWEAARASAAAPAYFEEFRLGEYLHQDGGILVNNPCAVAIHEAQHLWPGNGLQCVVSIGTGRASPAIEVPTELKTNGSSSSLKTKFMKILDSATDTEGVHTILNDLLPRNVYYRFNPYLTEVVPMDEANPEKIRQLEIDCEMYYRRNEEMFEDAARALLQSQTLTQRCQNWITLKRQLWGIK
ncbi:calcium-independent phospholipase A2-gamma isoform X2 [Anabrus simplex]